MSDKEKHFVSMLKQTIIQRVGWVNAYACIRAVREKRAVLHKLSGLKGSGLMQVSTLVAKRQLEEVAEYESMYWTRVMTFSTDNDAMTTVLTAQKT